MLLYCRFIQLPGEYEMAGSLGLYEREDELERVKIPGPITDDITISVNDLIVFLIFVVVALIIVSVKEITRYVRIFRFCWCVDVELLSNRTLRSLLLRSVGVWCRRNIFRFSFNCHQILYYLTLKSIVSFPR